MRILPGKPSFLSKWHSSPPDRLGDLRTIIRSKNEVKTLVFRRVCSYRTRLEEILHSAGVKNARLLDFGTLDGILDCVAAGPGITLLPTSVIKSSHWRDAVCLHEPLPGHARVDTLFIRSRDGFLSSALRSFLRCVDHDVAGTQKVGDRLEWAGRASIQRNTKSAHG
jgi:DNA-binding transcriptional LysR family regulator